MHRTASKKRVTAAQTQAAKRAARTQSERFVEAARELGADQSEGPLDQVLRKIVKAPVPPKRPKKPK